MSYNEKKSRQREMALLNSNSLVIFVIFIGFVVTEPLYAGSTLENTYINISAYDKPIAEVLKDIEKQTDYNITLNKEVSEVITIKLDEYPLDKAIDRVLSRVNHSIVYLDAKKSIQVKILDGKKGISDDTPLRPADRKNVVRENGIMSGSDRALNRYNKMKSKGKISTRPLKSATEGPMAGSDEAMAMYKEMESQGKIPKQRRAGTATGPMSGSDRAMERYRAMNN